MNEQILDAPEISQPQKAARLLIISLIALVAVRSITNFFGFGPNWSSALSIALLGVLNFVLTPKQSIPNRHWFLNLFNSLASIAFIIGFLIFFFSLDYIQELFVISLLALVLHYLILGFVLAQGSPLRYITTLFYGLGSAAYCCGILFHLENWDGTMYLFLSSLLFCMFALVFFVLLYLNKDIKQNDFFPPIPMLLLALYDIIRLFT